MEHGKRTGLYNICADYHRYLSVYFKNQSFPAPVCIYQTGYGDIVPKTMGGKLFTIFYAIISIPIFMWYIYRLGGAFRLVFMKAICILLLCVWYNMKNIQC